MSDDMNLHAVFVTHPRSDHVRQGLERTLADLLEARGRLADEPRLEIVVDTCFLRTSNLNRHACARDTDDDQQQPALAGGTAPTLTLYCPTRYISTACPASTFTNCPTGSAPLTDVAAPHQPLPDPLPDSADQPDRAPAACDTHPVSSAPPNTPPTVWLFGPPRLGALVPVQPSDPDAEPVPVPPPAQAFPCMVVAFDLDLLPGLRRDLLRLIDSIHVSLCLVLVRVLAAFAHWPDAPSLVLVLVAATRCYGHRSESDHVLPANRSITVARGELALAA